MSVGAALIAAAIAAILYFGLWLVYWKVMCRYDERFAFEHHWRFTYPFNSPVHMAAIIGLTVFAAAALLRPKAETNAPEVKNLQLTILAGFQQTNQQIRLIHDDLQQRIDRLQFGPPPPPPTSPWSTTVIVVLGGGVAAAAGILVAAKTKTRAARVAGATAAITATLFTGAKLIGIEKMFEVKEFVGVHYTPSTPSTPPPRTAGAPVAVRFPPFETGEATTTDTLRCSIEDFARKTKSNIAHVILVGRSDRRELLPRVRERFGSNWGLAAQRADCVAKVLDFPAQPMIITTAGPLKTMRVREAADMEDDRSVTALVFFKSDPPAWTGSLTGEVMWFKKCSAKPPAPDPCVAPDEKSGHTTVKVADTAE